jgi:dTDP-glucose pyrophosphorylase
MAAGMGSRYGGLKQLDPVDEAGHLIIDYSIFDAHRAGFETVIFVIKPEIEEAFRTGIGDRISKAMQVKYVYQKIDDLPEGYTVPEGRVKPWGTAQAVMAARHEIDGPFAVINADDYYGPEGFRELYDYLVNHPDTDTVHEYAMVGYLLQNTVTEHGSVSRGVCTETADGYLHSVVERTKIVKGEMNPRYTEDDGQTWHELSCDDIVSMNLWGFQRSYLDESWAGFPAFLDKTVAENPLKGEYYLPSVVSALLSRHKARVKVLRSNDRWYGVTYKEDKPAVMAAIAQMRQKGQYPEKLWD